MSIHLLLDHYPLKLQHQVLILMVKIRGFNQIVTDEISKSL